MELKEHFITIDNNKDKSIELVQHFINKAVW